MSLDDVSAYLRVPQQRRLTTSVPVSSWNISAEEQIKRGIESRSRLRKVQKDTAPQTVFDAVENSPEPRKPRPVPVEKWKYPKLVFYELDSVPVVTGELPLYADLPSDLPKWKRIILETCNKHKVRFNEITSVRRDRTIVAARQEAMWRMKMETNMSYPDIGRRFGGRDHTTVLHSFRKYEERMNGKK